MRDITTKFGSNAGKIWSILSEKGSVHKNDLMNITGMNKNDFYSGVGWLARENKIAKKDNLYELKNTNLEPEIGSNAGMIWKIIDIWDNVSLESIKKLSDLDDEQIHAALGWLAKEDKIMFNEDNRLTLK